MASVFTKIINGEIPCYKIAETDHYFAFLDIAPLKKGHVLVVPKKEVDHVFDLDTETYQGLFVFCKKMAKAIQSSIPCQRISLQIIGLEVPHAHVHLIPINSMNDCNFANPKLKLGVDEFKTIAETISNAYSKQIEG